VSAVRHLCYDEEDEAIFKKSYDDLFARIGAVRNAADFYMAAFPLPEKPMALVKRGQKTRSRARRAFRQRVAGETFEALSGEGRAERFSPAMRLKKKRALGRRQSRSARSPRRFRSGEELEAAGAGWWFPPFRSPRRPKEWGTEHDCGPSPDVQPLFFRLLPLSRA